MKTDGRTNDTNVPNGAHSIFSADVSSELWVRAEQIFHQSLERKSEKRSAFLDRACAGEPQLREEVERLLRSSERTATALDRPAMGQDFHVPQPESLLEQQSFMIGRRIGVYRLERLIGHGGMGTVYLARRADEHFEKRVALKLVKRGMDTDEILHRFRLERQTLAALDHPNIAKVIDGGSTEDGLPYLVMDYVDGKPVDQYCDDQRLPIAERLRLFLEVCSAVHYAHQNMIVHRDLKPSNILVTADGVPKLLDFGIVKLLGPDHTSEATRLTDLAHPRLSPDYASPEQIRGEAVSASSDVYSLGVILYKLLSGRLPHRLRGLSLLQIEKKLEQEQADCPSVLFSRSRRAAGVTDGGPSQALLSRQRREHPARLRRLLSGDLDCVVLMALRKESQRRYASVEHFADDIRHFLEGRPVSAQKDTWHYRAAKFVKRNPAVCLACAAAVLSLLINVASTLDQMRRADEAERQSHYFDEYFDLAMARRYDASARRLLEAGLYDEAEKWYRDALNTRSRIYGSPHLEVSTSHIHLGYVYFARGQFDLAEENYRRALEIRRTVLGEDHPEVASGIDRVARVLMTLERYAEAEKLHREALSIREQHVAEDDPLIAVHLDGLAQALLGQGQTLKAESLLRRALAIRQKSLGPDRTEIAESTDHLAELRLQKREYEESGDLFRKALELRKQALGPQHLDVAYSLRGLARWLAAQARFAEAETRLHLALAIMTKELPPHHWKVASCQLELADCLIKLGDHNQARSLLLESIEVLDETLGPRHTRSQKAHALLVDIAND